MIPRITRGGSAYGALHYDHGPGRRDEHENAHKVAGTVGGRTWKERAHAIDQHIKTTRPEITKPIVRTSLRLAQEDRKLTDKEWRQVAERYADRMGFKDCPWEAVRHADDHIHLTISRVTWDGKVIDQRDNYKNAQTVVRGIEKKHDLINAAERYRRTGQAEISRNDYAPKKEALRDRITAAERASDGTRSSYESELSKRNVQYRANVSKPTEKNPDGKMNGYSYGERDHRDAQGEQVWFKGSQLGREHGWTATEKRLAERAAQNRTQGGDVPTRSEGKAAQPSRQPVQRDQDANERRNTSGPRGTQPPKREHAQGEHDRTNRPAERQDAAPSAQHVPEKPDAQRRAPQQRDQQPGRQETREQRRQPASPEQQREQARARARELARQQRAERSGRTAGPEQQSTRTAAQGDRATTRNDQQKPQPKKEREMIDFDKLDEQKRRESRGRSGPTGGSSPARGDQGKEWDAAREKAREKAREQGAERRANREQQRDRDRDKDQGMER